MDETAGAGAVGEGAGSETASWSPDDEPDAMVYSGYCKRCDRVHRLSRTRQAEAAARELMRELAAGPVREEGKMYGVLLACDARGATVTLRAFSGRLDVGEGRGDWVPPVPEIDTTADEGRTFARLEAISEELAGLASEPVVAAVRQIEREHEGRMKALQASVRRARNQRRCGEEPAGDASTDQADRERKRARAARKIALASHQADYDAVMDQVKRLRAERASISRAFHARLRSSYVLPNPAGHDAGLEVASEHPLVGGVGQCCAPKLLVEATRRGLQPQGMAEFWWGPASGDGQRVPGRFYGPCEERCQPLMGHLLCDGGLRVVYRDDHLLVVDKPAGLPSVPGRTRSRQDSVQLRAQRRFPEARAAHRLDVDTSGLLLVALDADTVRGLSAAFAGREVEKRYVALLERPPDEPAGLVELRAGPVSGETNRQQPTPDGRLGRTRWRVLEERRVEFLPADGRTHQIRLAARYGLGIPIEGDALYGEPGSRLMLHAETLCFRHPITRERLYFRSPPPF